MYIPGMKKTVGDVIKMLALTRPEILNKHGEINQNELARRTGVNQPTIKRILDNESIEPKDSNVGKLARYFGVSKSQMRGEEPIVTESGHAVSGHAVRVGKTPYQPASPLIQSPEVKICVPLISWDTAAQWQEVVGNFKAGYAKEWLPPFSQMELGAFCLLVTGESMNNPMGKPSYPDGCIIYVHPQQSWEHKDCVIVRLPNVEHAVFKQIIKDESGAYLKPLNPAWPDKIIKLPEEAVIIGVVDKTYMMRN